MKLYIMSYIMSYIISYIALYNGFKGINPNKFLCAHNEGFLGLIFPKIDLFAHLKVIFFILKFPSQFNI